MSDHFIGATMATLAITDIHRLSALLEGIAARRDDLTVVSEIQRGIEVLEQHTPDLIIIQNHLSGLSADILCKHLKSRLNRRKVRFALISPTENLDLELAARFETILDPASSDEQLEATIEELLSRPDVPAHPTTAPVSSILELPRKPEPETEPDTVQPGPPPAAPAMETTPATYDRPRRPNRSIISAFSQHLDSTTEELHPQPTALAAHNEAVAVHELHQPEPLGLVEDAQRSKTPLVQRTGFWLVIGTVLLVVVITLMQQRPRSSQPVDLPQPPTTAPSVPSAGPAPVPPAADVDQNRLPAHGAGRLKTLPSFIPADSADPGYTEDNPGWTSYHGQANEFRIFREQDGTIKALQVIDRSGAGIQDTFYRSILKELAGASAVRTSSSEIKEGYEIRRGAVAGLELVQYRDAKGGRLRGIVITWP
jgi:CheY-like chemotaxis protein